MADTWALHNALKGWTLYDLTASEVQRLVQVMSDNEIRLTLVCQKNDSKWSPLSQNSHPDFFSKKAFDAANYPALGQDLPTNTGTEIETNYFVTKEKKILPRLYKRRDYVTACTIFSVKNSFATETVNVSEGGIQVKDVLPDWIAGYFLIGISTPDGLLQLMCSVVEDQKEKVRVQVVSEENDPQYLLYKNWVSTL